MYVDNLLKIIELLKELDVGCRKHRAYRAQRKPGTPCERCQELWLARQAINTLERENKQWSAK